MTAPNILPDGHGGAGTGRRGIFGWVEDRALPALFGGGYGPPEPEQPNPLASALMAAGGTIAQSQGAPRRFGEFGPSALASVSAGLQAGHQVYQDAQSGARRRAAYKNVVLPPEGPTQEYWSRMLSTALDQNDLPTAREISSIIASGNYYRAPEVKAERPIVLREGQQAFDAQGNPIAAVAPRPFAPTRPLAPRVASTPRATGAGSGQVAERMLRQSADAFQHAVDDMERLERENPENANIPEVAAAIEGAGHIPVVGGAVQGALSPIAQRQMTPGQQQYRNALNLAVDHYIGTLKIRSSVETLRDLRRNLAPQSGQNSPEVRQHLNETRAYLRQRVRQTAYGDQAAQTPDAAPVPGAAPGVAPAPQPDYSRFRSRP